MQEPAPCPATVQVLSRLPFWLPSLPPQGFGGQKPFEAQAVSMNGHSPEVWQGNSQSCWL
jgi:hypothetical protein